MLIKLIGYVEVNSPFYNFWPKLMRLGEETAWHQWPSPQGGDFLPLIGEDGRHVNVQITNNQVICAAYDLPHDGPFPSPAGTAEALIRHLKHLKEQRGKTGTPYPMDFPGDRPEELIRPAAEEGFLPVLSGIRPVHGGPVQVINHISCTAGNTETTPKVYYIGNWLRQKGPVYVDSEVILKDGLWYYGPFPVTAADDGTFTIVRPEDAPAYQLPGNLNPHRLFENTTEDGRSYAFPNYVFQSDLAPRNADAAEPEAELPAEPEPSQEDEDAPVEAPAGEAAEPEPAPEPVMDAKALADFLCGGDGVQKYRPGYSRNDIMSIAISLCQSFLTVFSGEPGTGKTSICNIFAQVLGLREAGRYVPVSVERGWTSKRDFIGYHNPLAVGDNAIVKANARLYGALENAGKADAPLLVLLDEANLSPMEYYWSDFMDIAGAGEGEVDRTIDLGGDGGRLTIANQCRFAATINTDQTTEPLSPRIIDRAAVVVLPSGLLPDDKTLEQGERSDQLWAALQAAFGGGDGTVTLPGWKYAPGGRQLAESDHNWLIPWTVLQAAFDGRNVTDRAADMEAYQAVKAKLMWRPAAEDAQQAAEAPVKALNVSISHRTEHAIQRFWAAARQEGVFEGATQEARDTAALDYAVAQHLLPKLGGSGEGYAAALGQLRDLCGGYGLSHSAGLLDKMLQRGGEDDTALNYYAFF